MTCDTTPSLGKTPVTPTVSVTGILLPLESAVLRLLHPNDGQLPVRFLNFSCVGILFQDAPPACTQPNKMSKYVYEFCHLIHGHVSEHRFQIDNFYNTMVSYFSDPMVCSTLTYLTHVSEHGPYGFDQCNPNLPTGGNPAPSHIAAQHVLPLPLARKSMWHLPLDHRNKKSLSPFYQKISAQVCSYKSPAPTG